MELDVDKALGPNGIMIGVLPYSCRSVDRLDTIGKLFETISLGCDTEIARRCSWPVELKDSTQTLTRRG